MHKGEAPRSDAGRVLTQIEADACCASSEPEDSSPSTPTVAASMPTADLGSAVLLPALVPALVLSDDWRTFSPIPTGPVPKHVLLSVFLV